jgi:hypothetical protein
MFHPLGILHDSPKKNPKIFPHTCSEPPFHDLVWGFTSQLRLVTPEGNRFIDKI